MHMRKGSSDAPASAARRRPNICGHLMPPSCVCVCACVCVYVCVCVRARARAYVCINTYYFDIYRKLARQKGKRHAEYMAGKQAEQEVSNVGLV